MINTKQTNLLIKFLFSSDKPGCSLSTAAFVGHSSIESIQKNLKLFELIRKLFETFRKHLKPLGIDPLGIEQ